jgi:HAMP domain-containing protein
MGTRTNYQELEDEIGILREEVHAIGHKQDRIQGQLESVHGRLDGVEALEAKVHRMVTYL